MADLKINLTADASGMVTGFTTAAGAMTQFASQVTSEASSAGGAISSLESVFSSFSGSCLGFVGIGGAIVGAITAITSAFVEAAIQTANYTMELQKLSEYTGNSTTDIAAFQLIAAESGVAVDQASNSLQMFTRSLAAAETGTGKQATAFKNLGIDVNDLIAKGATEIDIMILTARKLDQYADGAGKAAYQSTLFGRSSLDNTEFLRNLASQGLDPARQKVIDYGLAVNDSGVKASQTFRTNIADLWAQLKGMALSIGNEVIPAINKLFDRYSGMADAVTLGKLQDRLKELRTTSQTKGGFFSGLTDAMIDPAINSEIDVVSNKIAEVQARIAAANKTIMDGDTKKKGQPPSLEKTPSGPDKTNQYLADQEAAQAKYYEKLAEMDKSSNATLLKNLQSRYKDGEIAASDYYTQAWDLYDKDYNEQNEDLQKAIAATVQEYAYKTAAAEQNDGKTVRSAQEVAAKVAAIKDQENTALMSLGEKYYKAQEAAETGHQGIYQSILLANRAADLASLQQTFDQKKFQAEAYLASQEEMTEAAQVANDEAYKHGLESATDYYNNALILVTQLRDAKVQAEDTIFQATQDRITKSMLAEQNNEQAIEALWNQLVTAYQQHNTTLANISRDGSKQIESVNKAAADEALKVWDDFGKSASTAISDGLLNGFNGTAKSLLDAFKKLIEQMIQTAIINPIILPITTSMGKAVTGTGGEEVGLLGSASGIGDSTIGGIGLAGLGGYLTGGNIGGAVGGVGGYLGAGAASYEIMSSLGPIDDVIGSAIGSAIPVVGTVIGGLLGGLVGDLFGGRTFPPAMSLGYYPGQRPDMQSSSYWNNTGWQGTNIQGTAGSYSASGQDGVDPSVSAAFASSIQQVGDNVKNVLTKLGMDLSGFSKQWSDYIGDMSGMTQQQIETMLQGKIGDFVSAVSGINFTQFQKSGEAITDTIDAVLGSLLKFKSLVSPSDFAVSASDANNPNAINNQTLWGTNSGWDIQALWQEVGQVPDAFSQAFTKFTTEVSGTVASMNQNTTDAAAWRTGLDTLNTDLTNAYPTVTKLVQSYRTLYDNIPVVFQAISDSVTQSIGSEAVLAQNLQALDPSLFSGLTDQINATADAYANATPIVDSFVTSYKAWHTALQNNDVTGATTALQGMATALKDLQAAASAMTNTALDLISQIKTKNMTPDQQVSYYNSMMASSWSQYQGAESAFNSAAPNSQAQADAAEKMTYWGQQYETWVKDNMGISGATPNADVTTNLSTIATDGVKLQDDINTAITSTIPTTLTDIFTAVGAVTLAIDGPGGLGSIVSGLNLSPIFNVTVAAPTVTPAASSSTSTYGNTGLGDTQGAPGHASGLDYVPYDNYPMYAHQGEAVVTSGGNAALSKLPGILSKISDRLDRLEAAQGGGDTVFKFEGDASLFKWSVKKETIQALQNNPSLLVAR